VGDAYTGLLKNTFKKKSRVFLWENTALFCKCGFELDSFEDFSRTFWPLIFYSAIQRSCFLLCSPMFIYVLVSSIMFYYLLLSSIIFYHVYYILLFSIKFQSRSTF